MPVQTKEQHFKELKESMDKVTESITAIEIKMMNNHKKLINNIETIERKTDKLLLQLGKKNQIEINEISNHQVQIKKEVTLELAIPGKTPVKLYHILSYTN